VGVWFGRDGLLAILDRFVGIRLILDRIFVERGRSDPAGERDGPVTGSVGR
jgi:hypothetical protein